MMFLILRFSHVKHTLRWLKRLESQHRSYHLMRCELLISNYNFTKRANAAGARVSFDDPHCHVVRYISITNIRFHHEQPSKVESTVKELKKKKEESVNQQLAPETSVKPVAKKKSLKEKIKEEVLHYYHGFRLFFINVKISSGLVWRVLQGKTLTRREYRLLSRTVGDMFRLVPFSVFIVVPFMELLLPLFIKLFPGVLPSTFETSSQKETKIKQSLKVKLEMAKFLQETLNDMALQSKENQYSESAKEFVEWFNKVRTEGSVVSTEEIMKFSKLFEDEITLDSLTRSQLMALCRLLDVHTLGTNNFLRFQLRMKLRSLAVDDKMIQREGVDSMTLGEVQQACRARGMRTLGVSETHLRYQLEQWLDLSLNRKVPPSLLLLSRALMLPEAIPTSDKLKATISALPETVVKQTQAAIGEKEGKIDNKVRAEIIKEEAKKVEEERDLARLEKQKKQEKEKEKKEKEKEEILVDKAPVITMPVVEDLADMKLKPKEAKKKDEPAIDTKDLEIVEKAIATASEKTELMVDEKKIEELKSEMKEYEEDVEELSKTVASDPQIKIEESKAAKRLFKSLNKMIGKLDKVMVNLEKQGQELKKDLDAGHAADKHKEALIQIDDIIAAIRKLKDVPDQNKLDQITELLKKIDIDKDGSIKIEEVMKVIKIVIKENVKLNTKQIDELMEMLDKEEVLEVEDKIEKALHKDKGVKKEEKKVEMKTKEKMKDKKA